MSSEKKSLSFEELSQVTGGALLPEVGKFYVVATADKLGALPESAGQMLGPYETLDDAKAGGLAWAVDVYNSGYTNIVYSPGKWDESGWTKLEEIHYPN